MPTIAPAKTRTLLEILALTQDGTIQRSAAKIGVSPATIYNILSGLHPSERTRRLVENYFGHSVEFLLQPATSVFQESPS